MSTLTLQRKEDLPNLDGPNDLKPVAKTTRIIETENIKEPVVEKKATEETK